MPKHYTNVNIQSAFAQRQIDHCIFSNEKAPTPIESGFKSWSDLLKILSQHDQRDQKSGLMLGGYALNGSRSNANVLYRSLIQLDIDSTITKNNSGEIVVKQAPDIDQLRSILSDFEWIATSSHSHDPKNGVNKYRITLLPERNIQTNEYKIILEYVDALLDGILDKNAWQLSQAFYLPSCPVGHISDVFVVYNAGKLFPIDSVIEQAKNTGHRSNENVQSQRLSPAQSIPETPENIDRLKATLAEISPDLCRQDWLPIIWSIASHGWQSGYSIAKTWSSIGRTFDPIKFDSDWADYDPYRIDSISPKRVYSFAKTLVSANSSNQAPGDIYNGRQFCADHQGTLLYVHPAKKWMLWDGSRWFWCDAKQEVAAAKQTADKILDIACNDLKADPNNPELKRKLNHATKTQDERRLNAMVNLSTSEPSISIGSMDQLDNDPMLLCTQNGVVNLRTGTLLAHDPSMLITRLCNVEFDSSATCPMWDQFISEIFMENTDLIRYVQRAIGYSITGLVDEEVLFFMFGFGANGKSVFINTIFNVLADYAVTTPSSMLSMKSSDSKGRATPELTKMVGSRFAVANETQSGERLDEQMVKILVSRERISARHLYSDYFDFKPTHALWVRGNHKPIITGDDHGIWRRIHLIPFERTFKPDEADLSLEHKLIKERNGILQWMIKGCLDWQKHGLMPPKIITDAGNEYRKESDVLGLWIDELCDKNPDKKTDQKSVYDSYRDWCRDGNFRPMAKAQFTRKLAERGISDGWIGSKVRAYVGITLKSGAFMTE